MPGRCSLSSSCSTGVMPYEASVDTSPVRHTFLKFAAPNSWRLWTYHAQVGCRETRPIRRAVRRRSAFLLTDERPETVWKVRERQRHWQNDECPLLADSVAKVPKCRAANFSQID